MFKQLKFIAIAVVSLFILFSCAKGQTKPTGFIKDIELKGNQVFFDVEINDPDQLVASGSVSLKHGFTPNQSLQLEVKKNKVHTFNDLSLPILPDLEYEITLYVEYKTGEEKHTVQTSEAFRSENYVPYAYVKDFTINGTTSNFDVVLRDPYRLVNEVELIVNKGDTLVNEFILTDYDDIELTEIEVNTEYQIFVIIKYTHFESLFEVVAYKYVFKILP